MRFGSEAEFLCHEFVSFTVEELRLIDDISL